MDADIKDGRLTVSMECSKCGGPLTYSEELPPMESDTDSADTIDAKGFCTHCGKTWSLKVKLHRKTSADAEAPSKGVATATLDDGPSTADARETADVDPFYREFSQSGGSHPAQGTSQPRGFSRWWRRMRSAGRR